MAIDFAAVRLRHPLAEVARRTGLDVPKAGDLTTDCPFHSSQGHHSLYLHIGRPDGSDSYLCFAEGCIAHRLNSTGRMIQLDVVQWVRDAEGVNASQAVEILDSGRLIQAPARPELHGHSGTATVAVPRSEPPNLERTPPERLHSALRAAWDFYTYGDLHEAARDYLRTRRIDVKALEVELGGPVVGHTPFRVPDQLIQRLRAKGFTDDELVDAGLARRRLHVASGQLRVHDYFRQRLVVPVCDQQGRVIGMIGRHTGNDERIRRYDNSPRTSVYDKSVNLYRPCGGTSRRPPLRLDGQAVVTEGSLDALALAALGAQEGCSELFAPVCESGVALSDVQVDQIMAIHPRPPVLAFDGDEAGKAAAARTATAMAMRGGESVIVTLPRREDGTKHDPASWLAEQGPEGLCAFVRRGCLDAPNDQVRPRHTAPLVARELMQGAEGLEAAWRAATAPMRRMGELPGRRYALAATEALVPVVMAAAIELAPADRARPNAVIETVCAYGRRLPEGARGRYAELAVRQMAEAGLGSDGWLERRLRDCLAGADVVVERNAVAHSVQVKR